MIDSTGPIGVLDSGAGGLTVLKQLRRLLPKESVIYLADTANVPYGDKPLEAVRDLAISLSAELLLRGCKVVLMASGTSTAAGLDAAQEEFPDYPILGTIAPGARTAVKAATSLLGVMATNATARSLAFTDAVHAFSPGREVIEVGCPKFVPLVETGRAETAEAMEAALEYIVPLAEAGADAIILGCTHFPFLLNALRYAAARQDVRRRYQPKFVDPAEEVVLETMALLSELGLHNKSARPRTEIFAASGDPMDFRENATLLLGADIGVVESLFLPLAIARI